MSPILSEAVEKAARSLSAPKNKKQAERRAALYDRAAQSGRGPVARIAASEAARQRSFIETGKYGRGMTEGRADEEKHRADRAYRQDVRSEGRKPRNDKNHDGWVDGQKPAGAKPRKTKAEAAGRGAKIVAERKPSNFRIEDSNRDPDGLTPSQRSYLERRKANAQKAYDDAVASRGGNKYGLPDGEERFRRDLEDLRLKPNKDRNKKWAEDTAAMQTQLATRKPGQSWKSQWYSAPDPIAGVQTGFSVGRTFKDPDRAAYARGAEDGASGKPLNVQGLTGNAKYSYERAWATARAKNKIRKAIREAIAKARRSLPDPKTRAQAERRAALYERFAAAPGKRSAGGKARIAIAQAEAQYLRNKTRLEDTDQPPPSFAQNAANRAQQRMLEEKARAKAASAARRKQEARDADGDGVINEGTKFQRRVGAKTQPAKQATQRGMDPHQRYAEAYHSRINAARGDWPASQSLVRELQGEPASVVFEAARQLSLPKSRTKTEALREISSRLLTLARDVQSGRDNGLPDAPFKPMQLRDPVRQAVRDATAKEVKRKEADPLVVYAREQLGGRGGRLRMPAAQRDARLAELLRTDTRGGTAAILRRARAAGMSDELIRRAINMTAKKLERDWRLG